MADSDKTTTVFTHEVFQCIDTGHHLKVWFFQLKVLSAKFLEAWRTPKHGVPVT